MPPEIVDPLFFAVLIPALEASTALDDTIVAWRR